MSGFDLINGLFECSGGFFVAHSVLKLHRDKLVRGVSPLHSIFFTAWGFWNLAYYWHLNQPISWWGGALLVSVNTIWLIQMGYYLRQEAA